MLDWRTVKRVGLLMNIVRAVEAVVQSKAGREAEKTEARELIRWNGSSQL